MIFSPLLTDDTAQSAQWLDYGLDNQGILVSVAGRGNKILRAQDVDNGCETYPLGTLRLSHGDKVPGAWRSHLTSTQHQGKECVELSTYSKPSKRDAQLITYFHVYFIPLYSSYSNLVTITTTQCVVWKTAKTLSVEIQRLWVRA